MRKWHRQAAASFMDDTRYYGTTCRVQWFDSGDQWHSPSVLCIQHYETIIAVSVLLTATSGVRHPVVLFNDHNYSHVTTELQNSIRSLLLGPHFMPVATFDQTMLDCHNMTAERLINGWLASSERLVTLPRGYMNVAFPNTRVQCSMVAGVTN